MRLVFLGLIFVLLCNSTLAQKNSLSMMEDFFGNAEVQRWKKEEPTHFYEMLYKTEYAFTVHGPDSPKMIPCEQSAPYACSEVNYWQVMKDLGIQFKDRKAYRICLKDGYVLTILPADTLRRNYNSYLQRNKSRTE